MERFSWSQQDYDSCDLARLYRGILCLDTYRALKTDPQRRSEGENELAAQAIIADWERTQRNAHR